jgi:hypothetical protein
VFNYHGCKYHYHSGCRLGQAAIHSASDPDVLFRQQLDQEASEYYRVIGFQEEIMWECEWQTLKKQKQAIKDYIDDVFTVPLSNTYTLTQQQLLTHIENGTLYGLCRVDIEVRSARSMSAIK